MGDASYLQKVLSMRAVTYRQKHDRDMSCEATAQMLSNTLYYKRFFPYYTFNICAGLDAAGRGAVYTYDAIGSYERTGYSCQGSGQSLIMPVLDNQLRAVSPLVLPMTTGGATPLSEADALDLVKVGSHILTLTLTLSPSLLARDGPARAPEGDPGPNRPMAGIYPSFSAQDCFASAGERDIYTGDSVEIVVMNAAGVRTETLPLKLD